MNRILVLHYQDIRLHDNPALYNAHDVGEVVPVYILDEETAGEHKIGSAQKWWLHHALTDLKRNYAKFGINLILKKGKISAVVEMLVKKAGISAVYCNKTYEPAFAREYKALSQRMDEMGVGFKVFHSCLLFEQEHVVSKSGAFFKVFTPFWRHCLNNLSQPAKPLPIPKLAKNTLIYSGDDINDWKLLPIHPDWSGGLKKRWEVSESAGCKLLENFVDHKLKGYAEGRNYPARDVCSNLSPYLHFGMVSPNLAWYKTLRLEYNAEKFLSELGWREFSYHLLFHFPDIIRFPFKKNFEKFPWQYNKKLLQAWQKGETGIPIIDAGMRELWQTGFMHNRVRMLVASFLTKNLLIHWKEGERWFWDTLVDADIANNAMGWQWVAGSGVDAAPYFRIFNPTLQAEKFDPTGEYVKRYIPELAHLPADKVHKPWLTDAVYPKPVADLDITRRLALEMYKRM